MDWPTTAFVKLPVDSSGRSLSALALPLSDAFPLSSYVYEGFGQDNQPSEAYYRTDVDNQVYCIGLDANFWNADLANARLTEDDIGLDLGFPARWIKKKPKI